MLTLKILKHQIISMNNNQYTRIYLFIYFKVESSKASPVRFMGKKHNCEDLQKALLFESCNTIFDR